MTTAKLPTDIGLYESVTHPVECGWNPYFRDSVGLWFEIQTDGTVYLMAEKDLAFWGPFSLIGSGAFG